MARFCDRSPCAPLMGALGKYIFGTPEGFILMPQSDAENGSEVDIEYCPFCGTRLDEVPQIQIEKITLPRRRKGAKNQISV